jgi:hypothetical protein
MKALFVAAGPDIRTGVALEPFENVNVYPLIAKILGLDITNLKTGPMDGKLSVLEGILKTSSYKPLNIAASGHRVIRSKSVPHFMTNSQLPQNLTVSRPSYFS